MLWKKKKNLGSSWLYCHLFLMPVVQSSVVTVFAFVGLIVAKMKLYANKTKENTQPKVCQNKKNRINMVLIDVNECL